MTERYSTYEAKARLSELLRKVRTGESVVITHRGTDVAELRPIVDKPSIDQRLERLRARKILSGAAARRGKLEPLASRPGALERFLAERE